MRCYLQRAFVQFTISQLVVRSLSSSASSGEGGAGHSNTMLPSSSPSTANSNLEHFQKMIIDILASARRVPLPRLASMMCEKDEDLFESIVSLNSGGLLGVCKRLHDEQRLLLTQNDGGGDVNGRPPAPRIWTVERAVYVQHDVYTTTGSSVPPPQAPAAAAVITDVVSPTQQYWDSFDVSHLIPYIPASSYIPYTTLCALLPEVSFQDMPKEQRSKNIARCLRPFTDIVLVPSLMFRLNDEGLKHPQADPEGAMMMISDSLFDEAAVMDLVTEMNMMAESKSDERHHLQGGRRMFSMKDLNESTRFRDILRQLPLHPLGDEGGRVRAAGVDGVANTTEVVSTKLMVRLCRAYPTMMTTFTDKGVRFFEALQPPHPVSRNDAAAATPYQLYLRRYAKSFRQLIAPPTTTPPSQHVQHASLAVAPPSIPCSVERLAQWLAETGGFGVAAREEEKDKEIEGACSQGAVYVASVSDLLSVGADILPINESALITLAIANDNDSLHDDSDTSSTVSNQELRCKPRPLWTRPLPAASCTGCMPAYEKPDDTELDRFIKINKATRWSSKRKSAKLHQSKSGEFRNCSGAEVSAKIIAALRSKCPTTAFLPIGDVSIVIPRELLLALPSVSLLMFFDQRPSEFEVVETFTGVSTEYRVRVREIGEAPIPREGVSPGTFSEPELLSFIDHAVAGHRGKVTLRGGHHHPTVLSATVPNAWAKLPLSVRKQFRSNVQNFVHFLSMRPLQYDLTTQRGTIVLRAHDQPVS
jgi:hypothetical protein